VFVSVFISIVILVVGAALIATFSRRGQSFKERWPAISEEEFVAKCTPGTNPQTALRVRRIISEQLGIPYEHIHPEQHFVHDLDC
jgi:hypothetical protein